MSIIINGNITGNNNHFGDIYHNYLENKSSLNFTQEEKELLRLIFDQTSETDRKDILQSLERIRDIGNSHREDGLNQIKKIIERIGDTELTKALSIGINNILIKNPISVSFEQEIDPKKSLWENYNFIQKSLDEYDKGDESEVKRIAAHIRTVLYSKNKSVSIIDQLGKSDFELYDTRTRKFTFSYNVFNGVVPHLLNLRTEILPYFALNYGIFYKAGASYLLRNMPLYSNTKMVLDKNKKVLFKDWWTQEIFDDLKGHTLTRELLILNVAHKEGGAHLDLNQDVNYKFYKEPQKTLYPIDDELREFEHLPVASSVAQIAYEVLRSIEDNKEYLNN